MDDGALSECGDEGMGYRLRVSREFRGEWEEKVAGWSEGQCEAFIRKMREWPEEAWERAKVRWVYGLVKRRGERAREQAGMRTYWEERELEVGKEAVREERGRKKWEAPRWEEERAERRKEYERKVGEEKVEMERSWSRRRA